MKIINSAITMIILLSIIMPFVAADDDNPPSIPVPPNAFYGNVTINDQRLSIGGVIEAYVDGELRGSTMTTTQGKYGDKLDYLTVDGYPEDEGKTIIFIIHTNDGWIEAEEVTVWHIMSPPRKLDLHAYGGLISDHNIPSWKRGAESGLTNSPPIANMSISLIMATVGENIIFDASNSYDPDGDPLTYHWDFGDGLTSSKVQVTHSYSNSGRYTVSLTVEDGKGGVDTVYQTITIVTGNYPPSKPVINGPTVGHRNISYNYTFKSTDPDNDSIKYTIDWGDGNQETTDFISSGLSVSRSHSWSLPGKYTIKVTASDNQTVSQTAMLTISIDIKTVGDIGYLIDDNNDGIYDKFYSYSINKETNIQKLDNGSYLIDTDNDGTWDYYYNPDTDTLSKYTSESAEVETKGVNTSVIILVIIILIIFIGLAYISMKRKKPKPSLSATKTSSSKPSTKKPYKRKESGKKK